MPVHRHFFQNGKVLPILRGAGVTQPVMGTAAAAVARGDWLHIFPEGKIMYPGTLGTFRWGVGKIVCERWICQMSHAAVTKRGKISSRFGKTSLSRYELPCTSWK
eukprot:gene25591-11244_t